MFAFARADETDPRNSHSSGGKDPDSGWAGKMTTCKNEEHLVTAPTVATWPLYHKL